MTKKNEFPSEVYLVFDTTGKMYAFTDIHDIPVYYEDAKGVMIGLYHLRNVGKVTKETKYDPMFEQNS